MACDGLKRDLHTSMRCEMKRMLLTVVLCGLVLSAVTASEAGRSLTDQELWQVRGAATDWCALEDLTCSISPGATVLCESGAYNTEASCVAHSWENSGGGPWWRCGYVANSGDNCTETGDESHCKMKQMCEWEDLGTDSGGNPMGRCTTTGAISYFNSYNTTQVTGSECP